MVDFHPLASLEVTDAAEYYDDRSPSLGNQFLDALRQTLKRKSLGGRMSNGMLRPRNGGRSSTLPPGNCTTAIRHGLFGLILNVGVVRSGESRGQSVERAGEAFRTDADIGSEITPGHVNDLDDAYSACGAWGVQT